MEFVKEGEMGGCMRDLWKETRGHYVWHSFSTTAGLRGEIVHMQSLLN